jgi:hypothetical protein
MIRLKKVDPINKNVGTPTTSAFLIPSTGRIGVVAVARFVVQCSIPPAVFGNVTQVVPTPFRLQSQPMKGFGR